MKLLALSVFVISVLPNQLAAKSFGHSIQLQVYDFRNNETDHVEWGLSSIVPNPIEFDNVAEHSELNIWISAAMDQSQFNRAVGEVSFEDFKENLRIDYFLNTTDPTINYMLDHYGSGTGMRNQTNLNFCAKISHEITETFYGNLRRNVSTTSYFFIVPLEFSRMKSYFQDIVHKAPLNMTLTGHLYFMHNNKSLSIGRVKVMAIFLNTMHDSEYEAVALNANRTIHPRMGQAVMQTPPSISFCGHGGRMNKDGFCDCREGFSGPACMFPCPSSTGGVITPESCSTRPESDECVFGLLWLFNQCDNGTVLFKKDNIFLNPQRNNTGLQIMMNITSSVTMLPNIEVKFQVEGIGQLVDTVEAVGNRFVNYTLTRLCTFINDSAGNVDSNKNCSQLRDLLTPFRSFLLTLYLTDKRIAYLTKEASMPPPIIAILQFNSESDFPFPPHLAVTQNTENITFSLSVPKEECTGMLVAFEIECVKGCKNSTIIQLNISQKQKDCSVNYTHEFFVNTPSTFFDFYKSKIYRARAKNTIGWSGYSKNFEYKAPFFWPLPVTVAVFIVFIVFIIYSVALRCIYPDWNEWKALLKERELRKVLDRLIFRKGNVSPEDDQEHLAPDG